MKYVIVSDIHGNVDALLAVIEEIAEKENITDNLLIAGDIVGYGASPNECCDIVRFFMYGRKKVSLERVSEIIEQSYPDTTQKANLLKTIISLEKRV